MDENPYSAPATACYPLTRREFQPTWWMSWLAWLLRGGNRSARSTRLADERVFCTPRWAMAFIWCFALTAPALLLVITQLWWAVLLCLLVGVVGVSSNERVFVSADKIRKVGPFFRRRECRWAEIVSVTFDNDGDVLLIASSGVRIEVEADLVGVSEFADILDRRLPPDQP